MSEKLANYAPVNLPPMTRFIFVCFWLLAVQYGFAQNVSFLDANNRIQQLIYDNQYNQAQSEIYSMLRSGKTDKREEAVLLVFLSDIKRILTTNEEGMKYARKALAVTYTDPVYGNRTRAMVYHVIANLHYEKRRYDSAYHYAVNSIRLAEKHSDPERFAATKISNLPIIGYYYLEHNRFDEAEKTFLEANQTLIATGSACEVPLQFLKLADLEVRKRNLKAAEAYALRSSRMADSCSISNYVIASYSKLIDIYLLQNNAAKMLEYVNKRDSLNYAKNLAEQSKNTELLEAQYNVRIGKQENEMLKLQGQAQKNRSALLAWITFLSLLLLVVAVFAVLNLRRKNQLISAQKSEVDRLNALNRKIFSVISHDFKAPLHNLQGAVSLVEDDGLDSNSFRDIIAVIRRQTVQANLIMENLLNWARSELQAENNPGTIAAPLAISTEITAQLQSYIAQKNLKVLQQVPASLSVQMQPDLLRIVYRNLISNAVKYSFQDGTITVGYESGTQRLFVRDEGTGIKPETLSKLFGSTVASGHGTNLESGYGIGLQITAELIAKSNGTIFAENNVDRGATVYFSIPAATE